MKGQIFDLVRRDSQLKAQVELNNESGTPYEALCDVRTCDCIPIDDCGTGTRCTGVGAIGAPVGGDCNPSCGIDASSNLVDQVLYNANEIRKLIRRIIDFENQIAYIRSKALATILLDVDGFPKGGLTINGTLVTFTNGSWEEYLESQSEVCT